MNTEDDSFYEFKIAYDNPRFTAIKENGELNIIFNTINPLTSPGEGVTVFTYPYLSAGAPALGEAKGLISFDFK